VINLPETASATAAEPTQAPAEEPTVASEEPIEETPTDTPVPEVAAEPPPPVESPTMQSLGTTYTVQAGDSFATIAAQYGITVDALAAANQGVDSTALQPGQVLVIPPPIA
jgi:LysM repeat protein